MWWSNCGAVCDGGNTGWLRNYRFTLFYSFLAFFALLLLCTRMSFNLLAGHCVFHGSLDFCFNKKTALLVLSKNWLVTELVRTPIAPVQIFFVFLAISRTFWNRSVVPVVHRYGTVKVCVGFSTFILSFSPFSVATAIQSCSHSVKLGWYRSGGSLLYGSLRSVEFSQQTKESLILGFTLGSPCVCGVLLTTRSTHTQNLVNGFSENAYSEYESLWDMLGTLLSGSVVVRLFSRSSQQMTHCRVSGKTETLLYFSLYSRL